MTPESPQRDAAGPGPAVLMADVARRAGVSTATVSRALRDMPGVSAPTRARIKALADELSYVVSPEASGLASGTTGRIAVVVPKIDLWFFATMLAGIEGVLRDADMDVLIYHVDGAEERRWFFERLPARRKADAVIVIALPVPEQEAERLDLIGVQVVIAGGELRDYPHVRVDDVDVGRRAAGHLVGLGHRDIAMIRTQDREGSVWAADRARSQGYCEALGEAGIPRRPELMVTVDWGIHGGALAMERLLSLERPPTAVFAYSDEVAMGALLTLRRAGVSVPGEISVIGVDDHPVSELYDLTTVRQPVELQGATAGRLAIDLLRDGEASPDRVTLPTELVVRGTTGPPRAT
jgi:LacI family transcriptional regulator, repressor for deo operon, udp, cdd, tsx, nupC, and nupG